MLEFPTFHEPKLSTCLRPWKELRLSQILAQFQGYHTPNVPLGTTALAIGEPFSRFAFNFKYHNVT